MNIQSSTRNKQIACDSDSLQQLLHLARDLWSEPSIKGLIRSFAKLLVGSLKIEKIACFNLPFKGGKFVFHNVDLMLKNATMADCFADVFLENIKVNITTLMKNRDDISCGVQKLNCQERSLSWFLVGKDKNDSFLCVWEDTADIRDMEFEFLVRMIQHEAAWHRKLDKTQALLYIDELTGLFNYRYLDIALDSELRRASRYQQKFSLLFIDLDDFKKVNDRYGHVAGSSLLKQVSEVLKEELREVDTIIRYGGDEYVVLLLGAIARSGALVAERIRKRIEEKPFVLENLPVHITCSIGVACFPEHGKSKEKLIEMADGSMYQSKHKGKNSVIVLGEGGNVTGKSSPISR